MLAAMAALSCSSSERSVMGRLLLGGGEADLLLLEDWEGAGAGGAAGGLSNECLSPKSMTYSKNVSAVTGLSMVQPSFDQIWRPVLGSKIDKCG